MGVWYKPVFHLKNGLKIESEEEFKNINSEITESIRTGEDIKEIFNTFYDIFDAYGETINMDCKKLSNLTYNELFNLMLIREKVGKLFSLFNNNICLLGYLLFTYYAYTGEIEKIEWKIE